MNAEVTETGEEGSKPSKAKAAVESVTMQDGRVVEFVGKRRMLKESTITDTGVEVRLDFRNGMTVVFPVPQTLIYQFAAHGAEQKLGDETAGEDDVDDMVLDVEALIERLNRGEWSVKREGGGMSGTSVLLRALVEYSGKTVEQIKVFLQGDPKADPPIPGKTAAEKTALRNSPKLKPIIEKLESEKQAKAAKVDTEALLGSLG